MVLIEQSHVRTRIGGMNRRKERVPYAHPTCCAQRTLLNVHCTRARVPTVCQNTADEHDNEKRGRDHETNVWGHMPRDCSAVKAGNACSKAEGSYYRDVRGSDQTSFLPEVSRRTPGS